MCFAFKQLNLRPIIYEVLKIDANLKITKIYNYSCIKELIEAIAGGSIVDAEG